MRPVDGRTRDRARSRVREKESRERPPGRPGLDLCGGQTRALGAARPGSRCLEWVRAVTVERDGFGTLLPDAAAAAASRSWLASVVAGQSNSRHDQHEERGNEVLVLAAVLAGQVDGDAGDGRCRFSRAEAGDEGEILIAAAGSASKARRCSSVMLVVMVAISVWTGRRRRLLPPGQRPRGRGRRGSGGGLVALGVGATAQRAPPRGLIRVRWRCARPRAVGCATFRQPLPSRTTG